MHKLLLYNIIVTMHMFYLLTATDTIIQTQNCGLTPATCVFVRIHIASICGLHTQTQIDTLSIF